MEKKNTIAIAEELAALILEEMGPEVSYNFMTQKLGVTSLVKSETGNDGKVYSDIGLSSLALGGLTHGISPLELTAAYTPFANGGLYAKPYFISSVTKSAAKGCVQIILSISFSFTYS